MIKNILIGVLALTTLIFCIYAIQQKNQAERMAELAIANEVKAKQQENIAAKQAAHAIDAEAKVVSAMRQANEALEALQACENGN